MTNSCPHCGRPGRGVVDPRGVVLRLDVTDLLGLSDAANRVGVSVSTFIYHAAMDLVRETLAHEPCNPCGHARDSHRNRVQECSECDCQEWWK